MATGSDNNVWFTETNAARVGKITPNGVVTEYPIPSGSMGSDIVAGASGTLWFLDGAAIGKVTTTGQITEFPVALSPSSVAGIAYGSDANLWFTDLNANKIGKMTPTGTVTEYALPHNFESPYDIAAGPDGNLWYSNGVGNVGKITTAGVITEYSGPANANVCSIAAGPHGKLYAAEDFGIYEITTAGVITEFPGGNGELNITLGPDDQMWITGSVCGDSPYLLEFNPTTHVFSSAIAPDPGHGLGGLAIGSDGNAWIADQYENSILVYAAKVTIIGIRLNGELSYTDPTYGFELGYASGKGTQTQTISLNMDESIAFKNLDTIPHSAAFLGDATPSPSTWPATFIGSTTKSPAGTTIGTAGFSTGSLNPNQRSPVYLAGSPGFYMIGCQYHYVSNMLRTVIIVH
jgi:streptogramin lyase